MIEKKIRKSAVKNKSICLSDREKNVLLHIARGETVQQVADALEISDATVDTYLRRLFKKTEARNRTVAVVTALKTGLIDHSEI